MLVYAVLCGKSELSVVLQSGCQGCFSYFFSFGHWSVGFWWMTPRLAEATQRRSKTRTAAWRTPCAATAPSACRRRGVDVDGRGRWETHRETRCYPVIISCRVSVHFVFTFCSLCVHFVFFLKWSVVTLLVLHAVHRCSIGSNMKNQQNRVEVSCGCRCITVRHRESSVGGSLPVCDPSHHTSVRTHHSPGPSDPVVVVESKHVNTMYHRVIENP